MRIFIDGSGWNGRESKFVVCDEFGNYWFKHLEKDTSNEAEYKALLFALNLNNIDKSIIFSDSQLIVNQVNGKWKVKEPRLFTLCQKAQQLLNLRKVTLIWIPRGENKAGHLLEK